MPAAPPCAREPRFQQILIAISLPQIGCNTTPAVSITWPWPDTDPAKVKLAERRGYWKAVIAIAAKNARMAWAGLARGEAFKLPA